VRLFVLAVIVSLVTGSGSAAAQDLQQQFAGIWHDNNYAPADPCGSGSGVAPIRLAIEFTFTGGTVLLTSGREGPRGTYKVQYERRAGTEQMSVDRGAAGAH
jgi:hypothetical protein